MGICTSKKKKMDENIQIVPYKYINEIIDLLEFAQLHSYGIKKVIIYLILRVIKQQKKKYNQIFQEYVNKQIQLLKVDCEQDYMMLSGMSSKSDQRVWAVLCNRQDFESLNQWELQKGDLIKLGRMKLQLLEINYEIDTFKQQKEQTVEDYEYQSKDLDLDASQCRICFSKSGSLSNPLFSPCKCIGSMKYVHLNCLQSWIQQSIKIKNQHSSILYIWKKIECEICKMPLQSTYIYQDQIYCIMPIQKPLVPYVVWKITSDGKSQEGIIQVMELQGKQEIKIGRVHDCDIKLKDISISRNHAIIKVMKSENNRYKLVIKDNNSKFGTLLYAQSEKLLRYELKSPQKVLYQIGQVLLHVQIKRKSPSYLELFTCYIHPNQILVLHKKNINEQATIVPNLEQDKDNQLSFQTSNELNQDDIVINVNQI
ncbi:unnamed protein product [Paramecium pentaurelia]|uniref:Zinc finger protein n=1 Tax=Paramecium pentaurelia TaxID=43138 RepID=A0A8S1T1V9_9CILI|nr:unnamed protein product [Paramecium pentaurelia]